MRVDDKKDTKKAKGVKNNVVARTITLDNYTRCLNEDIEMTRRQSLIRSKLHEVYTISESKIAMSPYSPIELDSKRPVSRKNCNWAFLSTKMFGRPSEKECIRLRLATRVGSMRKKFK
ncbi:hypothetical protein ALC60_04954 [Trachymyrmex zeteki]|uniref:Uncharacterized protein n=1 Tax=Mycetomoellerius zeteki TaxID=64791 RepID=A0A151X6W8_9HYME|nr:hypothetical protein ALC60_04954 [Trachymyrmex zeteki]